MPSLPHQSAPSNSARFEHRHVLLHLSGVHNYDIDAEPAGRFRHLV